MMKLIVLAKLAVATAVPSLEGTWDAASQGHHVADVHVHGDRADFDDGFGDGDNYHYNIQLKNGLIEMNGWVARSDSKTADAILWHKDKKTVMWRRKAGADVKKLRGNSALEQSHKVAPSSFDDLIAQSEAARHSAATVTGTADKFLGKTEAPKAENATAPAAEHSLVRNTYEAATAAKAEQAQTHEAVQNVAKKVRKAIVERKVSVHALSQAIQAKYLVPLNEAQKEEKNTTKGAKHQRRKLFPAAMHSLAALMTNTQKGIDEDVFDDVIEAVRQIIRDEAATTTTDIETELNDKVQAIADCATQHGYVSGADGGTSGDYDTADSEYTTATQDYDTAYSEEQTTCTEKNTTCSNRDAKGQELYTEVTGSSSCGLPGEPDDTVTYDDQFVLADVDTWANTLITKHTAWDTAKIECTEKEQECADKQTVTAEKETIKTEKCTALEGAAAAGLSAYDNCYNAASGEYQGYDYQAMIDSVKNSIEAVETLMCYIDTAMEGLAGDKESRETKTDAETSCETDDATDQYVCTCSDGNGERYQEPYNLSLNIPEEPDRDDGWDSLGCADAAGVGIDLR